MQSFPEPFLNQIAKIKKLSLTQEKTFITIYTSEKKETWKIAESLGIEESTLRTRKTGIYQKFGLSGNHPGKAHELYNFLVEEYQKYNQNKILDRTINDEIDLGQLVQTIRKKTKADIEDRCGKMQVLDMTRSIGLDDIYTDVNILEDITNRSRYSIAQLKEACNWENFDRFGLGRKTGDRISGLTAVDKHRKLMIWGKPGAGKTTFLKYLAIQCINEKLLKNYVPIFVTLKTFADEAEQINLENFIQQQLAIRSVTQTETEELLNSGKALILLDGLDEVREEYCYKVVEQIKQCAYQYRTNYIIITCRIAAREYTFNDFKEVEVADFNDKQIKNFVSKWFAILKNPVKAEKLLEKLDNNEPIKELASNPLLLTLLCSVFGENADFPASRAELYKEGIDVLLKKWDGKRNIERDIVYKRLSVKRKEDLLAHIAQITFERGDYFFKQRDAEQYIADYIRNLPDAKTDPDALLVDSEVVLKSIQSQHGLLVERAKSIFSFSHLTFHEYFTAKQILSQIVSLDRQALINFTKHITEERWREVFLLAVEMQTNADSLLKAMKQTIDELVAKDELIQKWLQWVEVKTNSIDTTLKLFQIRYLYLNLDLDFFYYFFLYLNQNFFYRNLYTNNPNLYLDVIFYFYLNLDPNFNILRNFEPDQFKKLNLNPEFIAEVENLLAQIPNRNENRTKFKQWRECSNFSAWQEKWRSLIIKYRNIGHQWNFNEQQKELILKYLKANKLLEDCLASECYVSREVRQEIEDSLYLPTSYFSESKA